MVYLPLAERWGSLPLLRRCDAPLNEEDAKNVLQAISMAGGGRPGSSTCGAQERGQKSAQS